MSAPPSVVGKVDQGPTLLGVSWAFTVVATIFVALRYHCRINYQLRLWWDDAWMLIALMFSWAMTVTWTVYVRDGGASYDPLSPEEAAETGEINWISQVWCIMALMTGKLAVASLILRLQSPTRWRTILIWAMCILVVCWDFLEIIFIFAQCTPTQKLWNPTLPGHCWAPEIVVDNAIAVCSYMAFMDLALAAIPLHMIWNLQMKRSRKLAIGGLLSTGGIAFIMAIVKVTMLPSDLDRSADFVRLTVLLFVWNAVEVNVVIIAGCVPTLMPIVEVLRGRDPHRYSQTGKHSGRRLLFSKTGNQSSSNWSKSANSTLTSNYNYRTTTDKELANSHMYSSSASRNEDEEMMVMPPSAANCSCGTNRPQYGGHPMGVHDGNRGIQVTSHINVNSEQQTRR